MDALKKSMRWDEEVFNCVYDLDVYHIVGFADFNFGGGYFGTTAVASANADANGFGAFEYSPTLSGVNYYALCTKNIKEFG